MTQEHTTNQIVNSRPSCDESILLPDGRVLGYAEYGDPQGKPIFSFHGGLSSRLDVAFAEPICAARGIRLISVDRPGIGLSDYQPNRTLLDWPSDIQHLAMSLNLQQFAVFGWSGGGPYVLACALTIPDLLTRAGISGGMAPIVRPGAVQELGLLADRILFPLTQQLPLLARLILEVVSQLPPSLLKYILLLDVSSVSDPPLWAAALRYRAILSSLSPQQATDFFFEAFRSGSRGTVKDYQILGGEWGFRLEDISMPILLWQGEQDNLLPMAHARYLAKHLPLGQLIVVPDCGHFLPRSKMSEILTALVG